MINRTKFLTTASAAAIGLALVTQPSSAQTTSQDVGIVDRIVVTATKREENVQNVPVAVSAYNDELLAASGVTDIRELMALSPSLTLAASQSEAAGVNARIRGVGTTGDNAGLESSVGVFIDGVYRSRNSIALSDLGEIDRIEVLRGPQGTLFGRNVSAGALNIITKAPEFEWGSFIEGSYGNYGLKRVAGGITGPIADDQAALRFYGAFEERNGLIEDFITGDEFNTRDRYTLKGQLLLEPTDNFSLRMIADFSERDEDCCAGVVRVAGPTAAIINGLTPLAPRLGNVPLDPTPFARATAVNHPYQQDVEEWGLSGEAVWTAENFTLTSITAYRDWEVMRSQDIDFTDVDIAFRPENGFTNGFETFTQELRLDGNWGALDWLVGFFYSNEQIKLNDQITLGDEYEAFSQALLNAVDLDFDGVPDGIAGFTTWSALTGIPTGFVFAGAGENDDFNQDSTSWAFFTDNTIRFGDRFAINGGVRFTHEKKEFSALTTSVNNGCIASAAQVPALQAALTTAGTDAGTAKVIAGDLAPADVPGFVADYVGNGLRTLAGLACVANLNPGSPLGIPGVDGSFSDEREENEVTGAIKGLINVTDDILVYGGYSRGYKAGGYNMDRFGFDNPLLALLGGPPTFGVDNLEFEEETVDAYEVGVKTTTPDGRASVNVTLFKSNYDNFQLNTFNGIGFIVENIAEVKSTGVEVEALAELAPGLIFQGGVTYADTRYGDNAMSSIVSNFSNPNNPADDIPLDGRRITLAPLWVATGSLSYRREIPNTNFEGFAHVDARFDSGSNTGSDLDPQKVQDDYTVVNASMGVLALNSGVEFEVWARNLFDRDYTQISFDLFAQGGSFGAFLAEPRTYGFTARVRF